ncbi:MAG: P63C domain-containing protein [Eikenella corrodens]|uniref:P63C domain-containing protein n=1 Tax=Eikenella TaxID=538 RepID=UPI0036174053
MKQEDKPTGRAIGGVERSKKLSPERRSEIARMAANARHHKFPKAIRKGNFKEDFGIDVECYVLDDENRTAVISQRGMAAALGLGEGGARLTRFINYKYLADYIGPNLRNKLENPIVFQTPTLEKGGPLTSANGYDVTILIDLCNAVIEAQSAGRKVSDTVANQARIIISASAKSGIQELVYKLSGFDSTKEQFINAFKQFVRDEAKKYEKEFPIELYQEWARLYELTIPQRGWPWEFKRLTVQHIYFPLAKSQGKILTLMRISKSKAGDRRKKLFQFLNEIGTRALRMQLGRILEMAESSRNRFEYEQKFQERFGDQLFLPLEDQQ